MSFSLRLALFASLLVSATSIIIGVALTQTATEDLYHDLEARGMAVARGLADRAAYEVVALTCGQPECSVGTLSVEKAVEAAAALDVDYLLLGAVQKVSTLVGMGRVDIIDIEDRRDVFSRVLSFRGDTDEAFVRVADFVVTNVSQADFDAAGPGPAGAANR